MASSSGNPVAPAAASAVARAKGVNFVYFREFVVSRHGTGFWQEIIDGLAPEDRHVWEVAVASGWYPFSAFRAAFFRLQDRLGAPGEQELALAYEHIADRSLRTIYKMYFRLAGSPGYVLSNYPRLWATFFDSGRVEVLKKGDNECTFRFVVPEEFLAWLPHACLGFTRKAIGLGGRRAVSVREQGRVSDPEGMSVTYVTNWS